MLAGNGLCGTVNGVAVHGGNDKYIKTVCAVPAEYIESARRLSASGKTPLFFAAGGDFIGLICVSDTVKATSKEAVSSLKKMGVSVVMITGDNETTADSIACEVGIDNVIAKVLPDGKEEKVRALSDSALLPWWATVLTTHLRSQERIPALQSAQARMLQSKRRMLCS